MKWQNKGHEFDELGEIFKKNKDLLFLGDADKAKKMKEYLKFLGANIFIPKINYNCKKFKILNDFRNKNKIIKHINSTNTNIDNKTIIISGDYSNNIEYFLCKLGLKKNINYFISNNDEPTFYDYTSEFVMKYLSIFGIYAYNKVYIPSNNIVTTTVSNLNCTACLNFNPYNRYKKHNNIDNLKKSIDIYFQHVDMVGLLHITGGEPTLYPDLITLLNYINQNYRDKVIDLVMPTNAIKEISDELCQTFKECDMHIQIDNYLEAVPQYEDIYKVNIEKLNKYGVKLDLIPAGAKWHWVEAFPPKHDYSLLSDEQNTKRFDLCGSVFSEIRDGKIYACCYQGFAETAGIVKNYDKDDVFDLYNCNKKELIEFRLKYNNKGFSSFCKSCNGLPPLNKNYIKPALQTKGIIKWDGVYNSIK